jgi:hypothetical protein
VGVPVAMIGAEDEHDVSVRFSGAQLELFIDGVLVDEEWPIGRLRTSTAPCLVGAVPAPEEDPACAGSGIRVDLAAVWRRALSDKEITALSGGPEAVAEAQERILGAERGDMQYWRPRGHNTWAGDTMCAFDGDRFHLFYLFDRRHHTSKWGCGAHQFAHVSSADLVHWEHHPMALAIRRQWETFGTGCPLFLDQECTLHYGFHSGRMFTLPATLQGRMEANLARDGHYSEVASEWLDGEDGEWPQAEVPIGHSMASSKDGVHFARGSSILTPSQNMWVFQDTETGEFCMIWDGRLLTSTDMQQWTPRDEHFLPLGDQTAARNTGECPCYFEWNGWHYILMGRSGFWMSRHSRGPYWDAHGLNEKAVRPRWDIYEGLIVPMVAPFKQGRCIMAGFAWTPVRVGHAVRRVYAGRLVFRELVQHADGTLGSKWPAEMIPSTEEPIPWSVLGEDDVSVVGQNVSVRGHGFGYATLVGVPRDYRLTAQIVPGHGVRAFGVCVRGGGAYSEGCELCFEPADKHAQWGTPSAGSVAPRVDHTCDARSSHHAHFGADFALECVEGLNGPFTLDMIVKYDPQVGAGLVDACIDGRRTMITQRVGTGGDRVFLFAQDGEVDFREITIRPLTE